MAAMEPQELTPELTPEERRVREQAEVRIRQVASGLYLVIRATDRDQVAATPRELDEKDKAALRDFAKGLITVWDALNTSGSSST